MSHSLESTNPRFPHWFWWVLVVLGLSTALFLRLWHLTTAPPGFHLDEATDAHLTQRILQGHPFFYASEGWGREGMYYYLAAPLLQLTGDGILGMRLTSALIGMVLVGLAGLMAYRLFDRDTGLLTMAWMGLTFWPVFVSRLALRNITLPLTLTLTILTFWWAWQQPKKAPKFAVYLRFGLAGILLGLCLYTYQPSRVAPLTLGAFLFYITLFHRSELRARWRGLALAGIVFVLTALPLTLLLLRHPDAEGPERPEMLAPLRQLMAGDPQPLGTNALAIAKMFTIQGDPLGTYNWPRRPVFPGWTALLFYLGILLCLRRWRDPACALIGLWLGVMLIPSLLTTSAPHFMRSVGALTPVMMIPALGLVTIVRFLHQRWSRWGMWTGCLLTLLVLSQTAWLTWRDYFHRWALSGDIAINYNAYETAVARYTHTAAEGTPTVVGARFAEDAAPFIVSSVLFQDPPPIRWVLPATALVFPAEQPAARFILETCTQADDYLTRYFINMDPRSVEPVYLPVKNLSKDGQEQPWLIVTSLQPPTPDAHLPQMIPPQVGPWFGPPGTELPEQASDELAPVRMPAEFQHRLSLLQYGLSSDRLRPGEPLRLVTLWQVLTDGWPGNLAMFVHVLDNHSQIIAQQDQFGYPVHSWKVGDRVVQIHDLVIAPATPPGLYWIQIGFYERHLPGRWEVTDTTGPVTSDRLLLDQIEVQP